MIGRAGRSGDGTGFVVQRGGFDSCALLQTSSPLASLSTTCQAAPPAVTNEPTLLEFAAQREYDAALWNCFVQLSARRGGITKARKRLQDAMTELLRVVMGAEPKPSPRLTPAREDLQARAIFARLDSQGVPESVYPLAHNKPANGAAYRWEGEAEGEGYSRADAGVHCPTRKMLIAASHRRGRQREDARGFRESNHAPNMAL